jgi:hypothetical protein
VAASCDSKLCLVTLAQDYCGLKVSSQEQIYRGDAYVDMYPKDGCVWQAVSHFVPMVQVPRNMLLSEAQIKQAIVGLTLKYACATGERTVQVSAEDTFFMPDAPSVFVSQSQTQPGIELEYRMALPVVVDTGLPWTIYVDGMDGTVLRSVAGFICD